MNETLKREYDKLSTFFQANVVDYHLNHESGQTTIDFKLDQNREPEIISNNDFGKIVADKLISVETGQEVELIGRTISVFNNKNYKIIVYKNSHSENLCFSDRESFFAEFE